MTTNNKKTPIALQTVYFCHPVRVNKQPRPAIIFGRPEDRGITPLLVGDTVILTYPISGGPSEKVVVPLQNVTSYSIIEALLPRKDKDPLEV